MEIVDFNNTESAISELSKHRPFQSFDVFFCMENHWLSARENIAMDISPYGILKAYDGTVFAVENINCGYGGTGPSHTASLLKWLGIDDDTAEMWKFRPGIHVEFTEDGVWLPWSLKLDATFSFRKQDNPQVLLGDNVFTRKDMHTIYFVNPQYGNYRSLFNALNLCKPVELTYYCGENAQDYMPYTDIFQFQFMRDHTLKNLIDGGFIHIHGVQYDVVCFSDRASIYSLIQNLYRFYFDKGLFYEHVLGEFVVFTDEPVESTLKGRLTLAKKILFQTQPKERYESKIIPTTTDTDGGDE